jgi:hypothetical protein
MTMTTAVAPRTMGTSLLLPMAPAQAPPHPQWAPPEGPHLPWSLAAWDAPQWTDRAWEHFQCPLPAWARHAWRGQWGLPSSVLPTGSVFPSGAVRERPLPQSKPKRRGDHTAFPNRAPPACTLVGQAPDFRL